MSAPAQRPFVLTTSSLTDALYESVRHRIVNGDIAPGEKVTEARLSLEYQVARPTAKGCLVRLTASGFLVRSANKTAVVPTLGREDVVDVFVGREAIERRAVAVLAARHRLPAEAARAHRLLSDAAERGDFPEQVGADTRFHRALIADVGSPRLARMHGLIMGEVELTMGQYQAHRTSTPGSVVAEHGAILGAISSGDETSAEHAVVCHLNRARERLLARLDASNRAGHPSERPPLTV